MDVHTTHNDISELAKAGHYSHLFDRSFHSKLLGSSHVTLKCEHSICCSIFSINIQWEAWLTSNTIITTFGLYNVVQRTFEDYWCSAIVDKLLDYCADYCALQCSSAGCTLPHPSKMPPDSLNSLTPKECVQITYAWHPCCLYVYETLQMVSSRGN